MRGGPPAEHRTVTAGPNSGEESGFHGSRAVPHAVDARMHANQRAAVHLAPRLLGGDPRAEQLPAGDHAVGRGRQLPENRLYRGRLVSHSNT